MKVIKESLNLVQYKLQSMDQESKIQRFTSLAFHQKLTKIKAENEQCVNLYQSLYVFQKGENKQLHIQKQQILKQDSLYVSKLNQNEENYLINIDQQQHKNQFLSTLIINQAQMINTDRCQTYKNHSVRHEQQQFSLGVSQVFEKVTLKQNHDELDNNYQGQLDFCVKLSNREGKYPKLNNFKLNITQNGPNNNQFNLSNFNSFNNKANQEKNSSKNQNVYKYQNFEHLIDEIQIKYGKKLSQNGISKIITNLQEQCQKSYSISTKSQSKVNILSQRKIDINKKTQIKKVQDKNKTNLSAAKRNLFIKDKENMHIKKSVYEDQSNPKHNKSIKDITKKSKDLKGLVKKTLKIIRNNRASHLQYNDNRDIQQYCIINKIFGKNKKMILWAIQNERPIITLDRQ